MFHIKIKLHGTFHKNLRKNGFFRNFYLKRTYLGDRGLERVKIPFLKTPAEGKISNLTSMSKEQKLLDQGKISNLTNMSKE